MPKIIHQERSVVNTCYAVGKKTSLNMLYTFHATKCLRTMDIELKKLVTEMWFLCRTLRITWVIKKINLRYTELDNGEIND